MPTYLLVPSTLDAVGKATMQIRFKAVLPSLGEHFIQWSWSREREMFVTHTRYSEPIFQTLHTMQRKLWSEALLGTETNVKEMYLMKAIEIGTVSN